MTQKFAILKNDPFAEAARRLVRNEVDPRNKILFYAEVDLSSVEAIRARYSARGWTKPSYTTFVVKAVSIALDKFPHANRRLLRGGWWPCGAFRIQQFLGADITVQAERELTGTQTATFADVLRDTGSLSLSEIQAWLKNLAECDTSNNKQWRSYHWIVTNLPGWLASWVLSLPLLSPKAWSLYRGGAVLVNSPARHGVDFIAGSWPWPITVSFGLVKKRPFVRGEQVVPCETFTLMLSFDRRVIAGAQAARFFKFLSDTIEQAENYLEAIVPPHIQSQHSDASQDVHQPKDP